MQIRESFEQLHIQGSTSNGPGDASFKLLVQTTQNSHLKELLRRTDSILEEARVLILQPSCQSWIWPERVH